MNRPLPVMESTYIIEDHYLVRSALVAWFSARGQQVYTCDPGDLAKLDSAGSRDLVVIDLCLGDKDGVDVLQYLADRKFTGRVLLISAFPEAVIDSARDVGAEFGLDVIGTMRKPVSFDRLHHILEVAPRAVGDLGGGRRRDDTTLAQALAAGAVTFHHQPILDARTLKVHGIELLARLTTASGEVVSVASALEGAREAELHELAFLAIATADRSARELSRRGFDLSISVNVPSSLIRQRHVAELRPLLGRGPDGRAPITLEVSELDPFTDPADARRAATSAVLHGARLSLDDFGTLNSNIDRLVQIPFSELKVDRAFVIGCALGGFQDAVCRGAIEIGRARGAVIVAEGVETAEDLDHLRGLGVDHVQGYFISRPLAFDALVEWLADHRPERFARTIVRGRVRQGEDDRT